MPVGVCPLHEKDTSSPATRRSQGGKRSTAGPYQKLQAMWKRSTDRGDRQLRRALAREPVSALGAGHAGARQAARLPLQVLGHGAKL